jgi:ferredoxin
MVRIEFDQDCCIGSGICESIAEDVFSVGDDGVMTLLTDVVSDEREDAVTQAVARCPTGAIRVRSQG